MKKIKQLVTNITTQWLFWLFMGLLFLLFIQLIFQIDAPCKWLDAVWEAGDLITFVGTTVLGYVAWKQSKMANDINKKITDIELSRYKLEMRPFAMVTDYFIYKKELIEIILDPNIIYINVNNSNEEATVVLCVEMSFTNTTNSFISMQYSDAVVDDGTKWDYSMTNQKNQRLNLHEGKTGKFAFYAPCGFFESIIGKTINISFLMDNRFGIRYKLYFSIIIVSLLKQKSGDWYINMITQNYYISHFEKDKDGKLVEIIEEI